MKAIAMFLFCYLKLFSGFWSAPLQWSGSFWSRIGFLTTHRFVSLLFPVSSTNVPCLLIWSNKHNGLYVKASSLGFWGLFRTRTSLAVPHLRIIATFKDFVESARQQFCMLASYELKYDIQMPSELGTFLCFISLSAFTMVSSVKRGTVSSHNALQVGDFALRQLPKMILAECLLHLMPNDNSYSSLSTCSERAFGDQL